MSASHTRKWTASKPSRWTDVELKPKNAKEYPIARRLHYYTIKGKLSDAAKKFLEWATTAKEAGKVVERVGFIAPGE